MIENMVMEHGLVVIPMYDFYPKDARERDPGAGMNELRLSFCFSESAGQQRRDDMREAVEAFVTPQGACWNHLAGPALKTEGLVSRPLYICQ